MYDVQATPEHVRTEFVEGKLLHRRRSHQKTVLRVLVVGGGGGGEAEFSKKGGLVGWSMVC